MLARNHLVQTNTLDRIVRLSKGVNGQQDCNESIEALEFRRLIAAHKEPGDLPYDHVHIGAHAVDDIDTDATENRLGLRGLQERSCLGSESGQKGSTPRPFPFTRETRENTAATVG